MGKRREVRITKKERETERGCASGRKEDMKGTVKKEEDRAPWGTGDDLSHIN